MAVTRKVNTRNFTTKRPEYHTANIKNNMDIEKLTEKFAEELIEQGAKPEELIDAATCLLDKVIQLQEAESGEETKVEKSSHLKMVKTIE